MAQLTATKWTDATWNPVTGCVKVGPGCDHCYAERWRRVLFQAVGRSPAKVRRAALRKPGVEWLAPASSAQRKGAGMSVRALTGGRGTLIAMGREVRR